MTKFRPEERYIFSSCDLEIVSLVKNQLETKFPIYRADWPSTRLDRSIELPSLGWALLLLQQSCNHWLILCRRQENAYYVKYSCLEDLGPPHISGCRDTVLGNLKIVGAYETTHHWSGDDVFALSNKCLDTVQMPPPIINITIQACILAATSCLIGQAISAYKSSVRPIPRSQCR